MGIVFDSLLYDIIAFIIVLFAALTWYLNSNFDYWKKRGVYFFTPEPYFGNLRSILTVRKSLSEGLQELYNQLDGHKYAGAFRLRYPFLIIGDPDLIKQILVKDFQHFPSRGIKIDTKVNPLTQHLLILSGQIWRTLRTKLTPTFTSGKMKLMFKLMEECSNQLADYISEFAVQGADVEMKEVLSKFTTDVVGSCAFGLQFNSMADPNSEFRRMGRRVFETKFTSALKRILLFMIPQLASVLKVPLIDEDITEFFLKVVKETVEYREKNNVKRNDFLQLLIQLKNEGKVEDGEHDQLSSEVSAEKDETHGDKFELTDELLAAQLFVFFVAGFETSSTAMSFALYELALNPDIQARLREEVDAALEECGGNITYEAIQKMTYLDRVIAETLRKYPPAPNLQRACAMPYKMPGSDVILEKGTQVMIPIFAIQRDPKYYPNPEKFDPDRFTDENKAKRHHFTYLPFGEGPRICIGMRFGLLQSKLGLFALLSKYEFSVCEKTEIPIKFNPRAAFPSSTAGIILRINTRS